MADYLQPIGFWSDTSSDDVASGGRLNQLRLLLAQHLQLRIRREPKVHIFQDVAAIPHGTDWLKEIHRDRSERRERGDDVPPGPAAELTGRIIELAVKVHRPREPGLLEAVSEKCLCWKLAHAGLAFARQVDLPVRYENVEIESSYRADLIVEGRVVLELKSVEHILPVHTAQTMTYLRLSACEVALLLDFGAPRLVDGIRRFIP